MPSDLIVCPGTHSGRRDVPQNDAVGVLLRRAIHGRRPPGRR